MVPQCRGLGGVGEDHLKVERLARFLPLAPSGLLLEAPT